MCLGFISRSIFPRSCFPILNNTSLPVVVLFSYRCVGNYYSKCWEVHIFETHFPRLLYREYLLGFIGISIYVCIYRTLYQKGRRTTWIYISMSSLSICSCMVIFLLSYIVSSIRAVLYSLFYAGWNSRSTLYLSCWRLFVPNT